MVASGLGITVLPASAAQLGTDGLAIRPFSKAPPTRTVALAWRASFPRPQAIEVLCDAIASCRLAAEAGTSSDERTA